jgi:molybdopterin-guanine dinucleotide biosynthesis protein A
MSSGGEGTLHHNHDEFVQGVFEVIRDALEHDEHTKKQKTKLEDVKRTPVHMRFVLGKDDSLYLQAGLSLLHVGANTNLPLAPNALYSADVLAGIRKGIESARSRERDIMMRKKKDELTWVAIYLATTLLADSIKEEMGEYLHQFKGVDGKDDGYFTSLLQKMDRKIETVDKAAVLVNDERTFRYLLEALLAVVQDNHVLSNRVFREIYKLPKEDDPGMDVALNGVRSKLLQSPPSNECDAYVDCPLTPSDTTTYEYTLSRGLLTARAPHEQAAADSPLDALLDYRVPPTLAAAHRELDLSDVPEEVPNAAQQVKRVDRRYVNRAFAALKGNFAMDECCTADNDGDGDGVVLAKAKQLRWLPVGQHAQDLAELATWEHAAARCAHVARADSSLHSESKKALFGAAVHFKIRQFEPFYRISCAMQRGELPALGTGSVPLVSCPVASINGSIAYPRGRSVVTAEEVKSADDHGRLTTQALIASASTHASTGVQTYAPPLALSQGHLPVPTGAGVARPSLPIRPIAKVEPEDLRMDVYRRVLLYGLQYATLDEKAASEKEERDRAAELQSAPITSASTPGASGSAQDRRAGLWNEMKRELAISTDRVWTFVRTLSGLIGEDADSIIMAADDSAMRASQEMERQRRAIADRVTQFHARLVETLISSLLKDSKLQVTTSGSTDQSAEPLVVIDADTAKQIKDLASGESGRPFFEANVALRALTDSHRSKPKSLSQTVTAFADVVSSLHDSLEAELQRPETAGASLGELAAPRNSYFVRLRDDTSAAIRSAFDRFTTEFALLRGGRHVYLWELIEGNDHMLSSRFAEFVGHVLVQNRVSTGASAMYVSHRQLGLNAAQASVALGKLINQASKYATTTGSPQFDTSDARDKYFTNAVDSDRVNWASSSSSGLAFPARRAALVNRGVWVHGLAR